MFRAAETDQTDPQEQKDASKEGPVWNPWSNFSQANPNQEKSTPEPSTLSSENEQVPTPPPWPVDLKPPLPTNVPDLSKKEKPPEPPNLSSGEVIPEQKPQFEPSEKEYHREVLELLKKIDEKLDNIGKT